MYDDYEIYQFVESKQDKRIRIILKHKENVRDYKLISYPKYLMECHLGRYLLENETIDHIDGNYLNNDISNLQFIDRTEHCKLDAIRNEDVLVFVHNVANLLLLKVLNFIVEIEKININRVIFVQENAVVNMVLKYKKV